MPANLSRVSAAEGPSRPQQQQQQQHSIQPMHLERRESEVQGETLEFIHIGKTAGGSIEEFGAQLGRQWGEERPWPELPDRDMPCQRTNLLNGSVFEGHSWHHVPRCHWARHDLYPMDSSRPSFTVVRHPYARAISAFQWRHHNFPNDDWCSASELNRFLQGRLAKQLTMFEATAQCKLSHEQGVDDCHWLPQTLYMPVDNVLHYENLHIEWPELMRNFTERGLIEKSAVRELSYSNHKSNCSLQVSMLDGKTRGLLDRVFARDFSELGYSSRRKWHVGGESVSDVVNVIDEGASRADSSGWRFIDWDAPLTDVYP